MTTIAPSTTFQDRKVALEKEHKILIEKTNTPQDTAGNGIYERYKNPVVTAAHVPLN
ncbi:glycosidase, partial [Flavobacterium sp. HMWF030]